MKFLCLITLAFICDISSAYRWCCKSNAEFEKCRTFRFHRVRGQIVFKFDCVLGEGTHDCMIKIENNQADVIDLDGGDVFAYRDVINVVAAEDYGNGDASYYAVAVAKMTARENLTLDNLGGAKTCHTGVGKTAGWNMPIGWLYRNQHDPALFNASCAPGANVATYQTLLPDSEFSKWCKLCVGDTKGGHVCERDQDERYYGYDGALRCLQDGKGEVAFVSHLAALKAQHRSEYKLLCPGNPKSAHIEEWAGCTMGKVPSHAVVMRKQTSADDALTVYQTLNNAQRALGTLFTTFGGKNLLWGSKMIKFMNTGIVDPVEFVGHEYFCNIYALQNPNHQNHPDCN